MKRLPQYPGRGILCGLSEEGRAVSAYFITARSPSSRNRLLSVDGTKVFTEVADPKLVIDPTLLIYTAIQRTEQGLILANGDHSEIVIDNLGQSTDLAQLLDEVMWEEDPPHYTPRITALYPLDGKTYTLSIIRRREGQREHVLYHYTPKPGTAHLIHTYREEGEILPTYVEDPLLVNLTGDDDALVDQMWESLDKNYRLAMAYAVTDLTTKKTRVCTMNATSGRSEWSDLT
jgi:IMP cyclohydrolase